jgi:hypothetical protein
MTRLLRLGGGYAITADGKIVRSLRPRRLDVSARLRQRASKRIRVARRGERLLPPSST